ncbi:hypothetical protein DFJ73DRAFT_833967 [Zopfochytrium polystomum]|nr:hypothetical protein DFJ73DRAFT_833967 [Zopfochytrium polystomum]
MSFSSIAASGGAGPLTTAAAAAAAAVASTPSTATTATAPAPGPAAAATAAASPFGHNPNGIGSNLSTANAVGASNYLASLNALATNSQPPPNSRDRFGGLRPAYPNSQQQLDPEAAFSIEDFPALGSTGQSLGPGGPAALLGLGGGGGPTASFNPMGGGMGGPAGFMGAANRNAQMFGPSAPRLSQQQLPQQPQSQQLHQQLGGLDPSAGLKRPMNQAGFPPLQGPGALAGGGQLNYAKASSVPSAGSVASLTAAMQGMTGLSGNPQQQQQQGLTVFGSQGPRSGAILSILQGQQQPVAGGFGNAGVSVPPALGTGAAAQQQEPPILLQQGRSLAPNGVGTIGTTAATTNPSAPGAVQTANLASGDRFGLLGLIDVIRMTDPDMNMLALGSDLTSLGLDLNSPDSLCPAFMSAFSQTPTDGAEPHFSLPSCYRIPSANVPPALSRISLLSEESLFYAFYSFCRDAVQEAVAQELFNRSWRYHKERQVWITKEVIITGPDPSNPGGPPITTGTTTVAPSVKTAMAATSSAANVGNSAAAFAGPPPGQIPTVDRGTFIYFDPALWQRVKSVATISLDALEERAPPGGSPGGESATGGAGDGVAEGADGARPASGASSTQPGRLEDGSAAVGGGLAMNGTTEGTASIGDGSFPPTYAISNNNSNSVSTFGAVKAPPVRAGEEKPTAVAGSAQAATALTKQPLLPPARGPWTSSAAGGAVSLAALPAGGGVGAPGLARTAGPPGMGGGVGGSWGQSAGAGAVGGGFFGGGGGGGAVNGR